MVSAEEIRKEDSQIQLPVMLFETARLYPTAQSCTVEPVRPPALYEANLSGSRLPAGFISGLSAVGLLLWALLKLWLFEH